MDKIKNFFRSFAEWFRGYFNPKTDWEPEEKSSMETWAEEEVPLALWTIRVESMDTWNETSGWGDDNRHYQCKRMSSLFKDVRGDGSFKYNDIDASYCVDINNKSTYHNGFVQKEIFDKMFPITLPYMPPTEPAKIFCEDLLTDPKNGDFDTIGVFYILKPEDGGKVNQIDINRFFKEDGAGWAEITAEEYAERKVLYQKLLAERAKESEGEQTV